MFATFIKWAAKMKHAKDLAKQRWREKRVKYTAFSLFETPNLDDCTCHRFIWKITFETMCVQYAVCMDT